jgi:hypothetical protein
VMPAAYCSKAVWAILCQIRGLLGLRSQSTEGAPRDSAFPATAPSRISLTAPFARIPLSSVERRMSNVGACVRTLRLS